jgi:hypothetical protein
MVAMSKFNSFVERLAEAEINFASHTFKMALTNSAPAAGNSNLADITQIANGNGYTTGGATLVLSTSAQVSGVYRAIFNDLSPAWTATGTMGPFRYLVLYDDSHASDALVGWFDHGSALTLNSGDTLALNFDNTNGLISIT